MHFCTVINCMDGRVQLPVNKYLQKRFNVAYVDSITEAGPVRIISDEWAQTRPNRWLRKLNYRLECTNQMALR
jgi:hypothetical protein